MTHVHYTFTLRCTTLHKHIVVLLYTLHYCKETYPARILMLILQESCIPLSDMETMMNLYAFYVSIQRALKRSPTQALSFLLVLLKDTWGTLRLRRSLRSTPSTTKCTEMQRPETKRSYLKWRPTSRMTVSIIV